MAAVEVRNGYKYYGSARDPHKKIVLDQLDMNVLPGSIYGLLGASGCGKTTLLSCIVGRRRLNGGTLKVLGGEPGTKDSGVPGPRVGYMPQEVALLEDFTIAETLFYFGRIYGMPEKLIHERFNHISKLLDLPESTRLVRNLSGGQQRRVSFACALVHEPELLIMDEPTVGLDPLLRERIWDYLLELTKTTKTAVIITTHYIEEAKMAHRVGLMRNGILLAEDTPSAITRNYNCESLEDAFLQLCLRHGESDEAGVLQRVPKYDKNQQNTTDSMQPVDVDTTDNGKVSPEKEQRNKALLNEIKPGSVQNQFQNSSRQRMKALMTKNLIQLVRQPAGLVFCFIFPILSLACFYSAIGGNPKGLKLGIVNEEVPKYEDCFNSSLITAYPHDYECDLEKISCRYIAEMEPEIATKIFYSSVEEAYKQVKHGAIVGYIHFKPNFTQAVNEILTDGTNANDDVFEQREILVRMDKSDQQITYFIERRLREAFQNFTERLMTDCELPKGLGNVPVNFKETFYGTFNDEYTDFVAPGVIMTMIFFLAALGTATLFITERLEGIWDRVLVAGISAMEILLAHIMTQTVVLTLQCAEILYFAAFIFGSENKGDNLTIIFLLVLLGFSGMLFGLLISITCDSHTTASYVATGFFYPMIVLCGLLWPIEGMPTFLKEFAIIFPFTLPSIAMRNVLVKGWGIASFDVYIGFIVLFSWIIIFSVLCVVGLKIKK